MGLLPKGMVKATAVDPRRLAIGAKPKTGKTTIAAELTKDESWLLVDIEGGSDYLDAHKVSINTMKEFGELEKEIKEAGYPYKGIIIDTTTVLEQWAKDYALFLHKSTPEGAMFPGDDITNLAHGAGWAKVRDAFAILRKKIEGLSPYTIYLSHTATKYVEKNDQEVPYTAIDLQGKLSSVFCSQIDAVAFLKREENKTILSFQASEQAISGGRALHLRGKDITVATFNAEENILDVDWSEVFIEK
tara:strand:+ start:30 stop:767 length:738 start_codon:yes stop_codon:yes gene_type:complete